MELWPGYHINVARSDHDQMLLRVETVKEIVHDKNVMEFYTECVRKHGNNSMVSSRNAFELLKLVFRIHIVLLLME